MKKKTTVLAVGLAMALAFLYGTSPTAAEIIKVINIDINSADGDLHYTGASANGPIESGTTWNYYQFSTSTSLDDLLDDSGAATTVSVAFESGWYSSFEAGTPNNLQGDRAYTTNANVGSFTISGLEANGLYNLALLGHDSTSSPERFYTNFTIGGTTKTAEGGSAGTDANGPLTFTEGGTHVLFSNIAADTDGVITFETRSKPGAQTGGFDSYGTLTGLQIAVIPEPASLGLFGFFGLLLWMRRKMMR